VLNVEMWGTIMTPHDLTAIIGRIGIHKNDVATICGVSLKTLYSWLNGQHSIPRSVSILLCAVDTGAISLDWIVDQVETEMRESVDGL